MKLFFITGENSGDSLAASLINALKKKHGDSLECMGIGGPRMKATGYEELLPMDQISVIGIWEVLPKIPRLIKINKAIVQEIENQQPDAVITVDFPDFNFKIAQSLKKRGVYKGKIIHYVAPSVWAWRPGRAKKISAYVDGIMCLFPMEVEHFTKHGMKASHVGHPLVESGAEQQSGEDFINENGVPKDESNIIGLLFGSRESEFKNMSEIVKNSATLINEVEGDVTVITPTLPDLEFQIQNITKSMGLPTFVVANPNLKWQAMKACDVAIAVSGTVALELAYAGVPHVIAYKISPITALILKFMVKIKYAHLANILLDEALVPEYLQGKCIPEHIAQGVLELLSDEKKRNAQLEGFQRLKPLLKGEKDTPPSEQAADFVEQTIKE